MCSNECVVCKCKQQRAARIIKTTIAELARDFSSVLTRLSEGTREVGLNLNGYGSQLGLVRKSGEGTRKISGRNPENPIRRSFKAVPKR